MENINKFLAELQEIPRKHIIAIYLCGCFDTVLIVAVLKLLKVL
jgi:hypothetical protein